MNVLQIIDFTYELESPIVGARQTIAAREGFLLRMEVDGLRVDGECCPLPGFSRESLEECRRLATRWLDRRHLDDGVLQDFSADAAAFPALRSAVETLRIQLAAAQGRTILGWPERVREEVQAHALVADERAAVAALTEGFQTLKIKVGAQPLRDEVRRVRAIRRAVGDAARIRLDANRAWSEEDARTALDGFQPERIEFIEEPLASGGPAALAALRTYSTIPIAADEQARDEASVRALLQHESADVIVLKPALCGGPLTTLKLAEACVAKGVRVVVTTAFDGPVGTAMTLELCARLPGIAIAHGVATGRLFAERALFAQPTLGTFLLGGGR